MFYACAVLNSHNTAISGSTVPQIVSHIERASPKLNVWCGLRHNRNVDTFFFVETAVTSRV